MSLEKLLEDFMQYLYDSVLYDETFGMLKWKKIIRDFLKNHDFPKERCRICKKEQPFYCLECFKRVVTIMLKQRIKRRPPLYIRSSKRRKEKGDDFEKLVKRLLEASGWFVFQCKDSKPLDLIAHGFTKWGKRKVYFVECKSHHTLFHNQFERLQKIAERLEAPVMVVYLDVDGVIKVRRIYANYWLHGKFEDLVEGKL